MALIDYRTIVTKSYILKLKTKILADDIVTGGAALTFFLILSIFPTMIFLLALLPYLPIQNLDQSIMKIIFQVLPNEAAAMFSESIHKLTSDQDLKLISFGFFATIWASSSGMSGIIRQLNKIYDVKVARPLWKSQGVAILMTIIFFPFTILAMSLIALGKNLQEGLAHFFGYHKPMPLVFEITRFSIAIFFLLMGLSCIYYYAPSVKQKFKLITVGSVVAVLLFIVASLGFRFYVENFTNYSAMYGSIGTVIVLMLSLYITGIALLFGAEINVTLAAYQFDRKHEEEELASK